MGVYVVYHPKAPSAQFGPSTRKLVLAAFENRVNN